MAYISNYATDRTGQSSHVSSDLFSGTVRVTNQAQAKNVGNPGQAGQVDLWRP